MVSRIVFTVYVDIDEDKLDNPGGFSLKTGEQFDTDKSLQTKNALNVWAGDLIKNQSQYALKCGADYVVRQGDAFYKTFREDFASKHPQISEYDIINFYKHYLMAHYANIYDEVCYFDLDVVVNTEENIFEAHDIHNMFACRESNDEAAFGKRLPGPLYDRCIRNPASKYWNAFAMLLDSGWTQSEADTDVFNTGIMIASASQIKKLDYFGGLEDIISDMEYLKTDTSIFHPNIVRSFNYDNETIFSYKRVVNDVDILYISMCWHSIIQEGSDIDPDAKIYHVISKDFEALESILRPHRG